MARKSNKSKKMSVKVSRNRTLNDAKSNAAHTAIHHLRLIHGHHARRTRAILGAAGAAAGVAALALATRSNPALAGRLAQTGRNGLATMRKWISNMKLLSPQTVKTTQVALDKSPGAKTIGDMLINKTAPYVPSTGVNLAPSGGANLSNTPVAVGGGGSRIRSIMTSGKGRSPVLSTKLDSNFTKAMKRAVNTVDQKVKLKTDVFK